MEDYSENINSDMHVDDNVSIRSILEQYLGYWRWILLSIIISLAVVFFQLNFLRPQYRSMAKIKIKDEKGGDKSTLSVFEDLSIMQGANQNIEDEIEILMSKNLLAEVVKSLKLNVQFYTDRNVISDFLDENLGMSTHFFEQDQYQNPPLNVNFLIDNASLYATNYEFIITINSENKFTYKDFENDIMKNYSFGEKVSTNFGDIIITPNVDLKSNNLIGEDVLVSISSIYNLARSYGNRLEIEAKSDYSSVLVLTIKDWVKRRGEDFLNELINKYNERAIKLKEELSKSTSDFVTQRLEIISEELSNVDLTAESLKTRYRLSDAASETGLNMQSGQEIERQIVQANTELEKLGQIKDYISSKNTDDFLPGDLGISDNNVSNSFQQYNELMLRKKKLLENSTEKNPIVVNINEQLKSIKGNIESGLTNLESSQKITLDALSDQGARISSKLYSAPRQERQIRDIQRQQQIKEQLYLYLLQKREETAITLGVADPNAVIIDEAESTIGAISPKKKIFYLAAILVGGLIPIIIIYLINFLNTKIKSKEDIQRLVNIPILGDIPKFEGKKSFLISKNDHSSVAEAFRILRTNLGFLLTHADKKGKTIYITSTIAHEGKSFVSSNLAASLAYASKKTLILGMDIRAPKIKSYLGIRGTKGVTNYIVDSKLTLKDITVQVPKVENLDLISSGDIAPNPAELLMNSRVKQLFDEVKDKYEYIIVDTAASSIITDTMLIRNYADAFVYVVRANYLDKRQLTYLKSVYKENRYQNMAVLVNGVDPKKGYGYGYGYGAEFEKSNKKWWKFG